jgi:hypothetical protein
MSEDDHANHGEVTGLLFLREVDKTNIMHGYSGVVASEISAKVLPFRLTTSCFLTTQGGGGCNIIIIVLYYYCTW